MREVLDFFWDYRANWKFIGVELGIDTGTLNSIDKDNRWCEEALLSLITLWLQGTKPLPTMSAMSMALKSKKVSGTEETSAQGESSLATFNLLTKLNPQVVLLWIISCRSEEHTCKLC